MPINPLDKEPLKFDKKTFKEIEDLIDRIDLPKHELGDVSSENEDKLRKYLLQKVKFVFYKSSIYEEVHNWRLIQEKSPTQSQYSRIQPDMESFENSFRQLYIKSYNDLLSEYFFKKNFGEKINILFDILFPPEGEKNLARIIESDDKNLLNFVKNKIKTALYLKFNQYSLEVLDQFIENLKHQPQEIIFSVRKEKLSEIGNDNILVFRDKYISKKSKKIIESNFKKRVEKEFPEKISRYFADLYCENNSINPQKAEEEKRKFVNKVKKQIFLKTFELYFKKHLETYGLRSGYDEIDEELIKKMSASFKETLINSLKDIFFKKSSITISKDIQIEKNSQFEINLDYLAKKAIDDENKDSLLALLELFNSRSRYFEKEGVFQYALEKKDLSICKLFDLDKLKEYLRINSSGKDTEAFFSKLFVEALEFFNECDADKISSNAKFIDYLVGDIGVSFDWEFILEKIKSHQILQYTQDLMKILESTKMIYRFKIINSLKEIITYHVNNSFETAEAFLRVREESDFFRGITFGFLHQETILKLTDRENYAKYPLLVKFYNLKIALDDQQIEQGNLDFLKKFYESKEKEEFCKKIFFKKNIKGESLFIRMIIEDKSIKDSEMKLNFLFSILSKDQELIEIITRSKESLFNPVNNWGPLEYLEDFLVKSILKPTDQSISYLYRNSIKYTTLKKLNFKSPIAIKFQSLSDLKKEFGQKKKKSLLNFGKFFFSKANKLNTSIEHKLIEKFSDFLNSLEITLPYGDLIFIDQIKEVDSLSLYHQPIEETFNKTPLHYAVLGFNYKKCRFLLQLSPQDINAVTTEQTSVTRPDIPKLLLNKPIHLIKWKEGQKKYENLKLFELLVKHGCDANEGNGIGNTALMLAFAYGVKEVLAIYIREVTPHYIEVYKSFIDSQTHCLIRDRDIEELDLEFKKIFKKTTNFGKVIYRKLIAMQDQEDQPKMIKMLQDMIVKKSDKINSDIAELRGNLERIFILKNFSEDEVFKGNDIVNSALMMALGYGMNVVKVIGKKSQETFYHSSFAKLITSETDEELLKKFKKTIHHQDLFDESFYDSLARNLKDTQSKELRDEFLEIVDKQDFNEIDTHQVSDIENIALMLALQCGIEEVEDILKKIHLKSEDLSDDKYEKYQEKLGELKLDQDYADYMLEDSEDMKHSELKSCFRETLTKYFDIDHGDEADSLDDYSTAIMVLKNGIKELILLYMKAYKSCYNLMTDLSEKKRLVELPQDFIITFNQLNRFGQAIYRKLLGADSSKDSDVVKLYHDFKEIYEMQSLDDVDYNFTGNLALVLALKYGIKKIMVTLKEVTKLDDFSLDHDSLNDETAIELLEDVKDEDVDKFRLEFKEIFEKQNIFKETSFHKLAIWSHANLFREVASFGCDLWIRDDQGKTCLDYVIKNIEDGNSKGFGISREDNTRTNIAIIDCIFKSDVQNSYRRVEEFLDQIIQQDKIKVLVFLIDNFSSVFRIINDRSNILSKIQTFHPANEKIQNAYLRVANKNNFFDDVSKIVKDYESLNLKKQTDGQAETDQGLLESSPIGLLKSSRLSSSEQMLLKYAESTHCQGSGPILKRKIQETFKESESQVPSAENARKKNPTDQESQKPTSRPSSPSKTLTDKLHEKSRSPSP